MNKIWIEPDDICYQVYTYYLSKICLYYEQSLQIYDIETYRCVCVFIMHSTIWWGYQVHTSPFSIFLSSLSVTGLKRLSKF